MLCSSKGNEVFQQKSGLKARGLKQSLCKNEEGCKVMKDVGAIGACQLGDEGWWRNVRT